MNIKYREINGVFVLNEIKEFGFTRIWQQVFTLRKVCVNYHFKFKQCVKIKFELWPLRSSLMAYWHTTFITATRCCNQSGMHSRARIILPRNLTYLAVYPGLSSTLKNIHRSVNWRKINIELYSPELYSLFTSKLLVAFIRIRLSIMQGNCCGNNATPFCYLLEISIPAVLALYSRGEKKPQWFR